MGKIFYHIHKNGILDEKWNIGETIKFGNEYNMFYKMSIDFCSRINICGTNYPIENVYKDMIYNHRFENVLELLDVYNKFLSETGILLRELGMEEIRKQFFSNKPSRTNCIWLCRKNQLGYWLNRMNASDYKIFKVEIFDDVYKFNEEYLPLPADSYLEITEKAKKYWNYSDDNEKDNDEYLYTGVVKILEEVDEW